MSKESYLREQTEISLAVYELLSTPVVEGNRIAVVIEFGDLEGIWAVYTEDKNFRNLDIKSEEKAKITADTYHFPNGISKAIRFKFTNVDYFIKTAGSAFKHREGTLNEGRISEVNTLLDTLDKLHSCLHPTIDEELSRVI